MASHEHPPATSGNEPGEEGVTPAQEAGEAARVVSEQAVRPAHDLGQQPVAALAHSAEQRSTLGRSHWRARLRERWLDVFTAAAVLASLLACLGTAGLWEPFELEVVEKARRIGASLFGFESLVIDGENNQVPTLEELGRGQLPFSLIALGLGLFGLHDWAARLPLGLCALLGIGATHLLVRRLADRKAANYAVLALATMPLFFVHARTALGDMVALAGVAVSVCALSLALFDVKLGARSRASSLVLGLSVMAVLASSAGLAVSCAVPCLGVGGAWACQRPSQPGHGRLQDTLGVVLLSLGIVALGLSGWALQQQAPGDYSVILGVEPKAVNPAPTHDWTVHQLGHALFPWSALVPVALAAELSTSGHCPRRQGLGLVCVTTLLSAWAVHGWLTPHGAPTSFAALAALAALIGLWWRGLELGTVARSYRQHCATGLVILASLLVLVFDFRRDPDTSLSVYAFELQLPSDFSSGPRYFVAGGLALAALCLIACYGAATTSLPKPRGLRWELHRSWWCYLRPGAGGRWGWGLGALALVSALIVSAPTWAYRLPRSWGAIHLEKITQLGWAGLVSALGVVLLPSAVLLLSDVNDWFWRRRVRAPATAVGLGFTALGLALSLGYYPSLGRALSPKTAYQAFAELGARGEPLGVLGGRVGSARYYIGNELQDFEHLQAAAAWLLEAGSDRTSASAQSTRRWLLVRRAELAELNALYRGHFESRSNLPILDSTAGDVLLATSELVAAEANRNPLQRWLPSQKPQPARTADFVFAGVLRCLGWEVVDARGTSVDELVRGKDYELSFYYEVLGPVAGEWMSFVHLDGGSKRVNGDHETLDGDYPFRFWRPGDYIADRLALNVPSSYGSGTYSVYFGFFKGGERLKVTRGQHTEDRPLAGHLQLR